MSLITRLVEPLEGEEKLPVHAFMAALAEYKRGEATGPQVLEAFGLEGADVTDAQAIIAEVESGALTREMIHDILILGEGGYYPLSKVKSRLGI